MMDDGISDKWLHYTNKYIYIIDDGPYEGAGEKMISFRNKQNQLTLASDLQKKKEEE